MSANNKLSPTPVAWVVLAVLFLFIALAHLARGDYWGAFNNFANANVVGYVALLTRDLDVARSGLRDMRKASR